MARKQIWIGRILSGLPVLFLVFDGVIKLFKPAPVITANLQLGYPESTIVGIGIVELICTLFYAIPQTAPLGAVLLTGYLGGAIATHVRVGNPLFTHMLFPIYVAALLWGGLLLRDDRVKVLLHRKRKVAAHSVRSTSKRNYVLWGVQIVLAAVFLFAGGMKLVLSIETLSSMGSPNAIALPGAFLRFIGVAEVLGAMGLILPGAFRIRRELTSLAASGLVLIMGGATVLTLATGEVGAATVPFVVGLLATWVARNRRPDSLAMPSKFVHAAPVLNSVIER